MAISAIYPGSFDPITRGHLDILERFSPVFDCVYIAVGNSTKKNYLFDLEERKALISEVTAHIPNVKVGVYLGLTVDYAKEVGAKFIIRGVRTAGDYEYEQRMASMNYKLEPGIDTILVYSKPELNIVSSSLIKEVASLGGDVSAFVPEVVAKSLIGKLKKETKHVK